MVTLTGKAVVDWKGPLIRSPRLAGSRTCEVFFVGNPAGLPGLPGVHGKTGTTCFLAAGRRQAWRRRASLIVRPIVPVKATGCEGVGTVGARLSISPPQSRQGSRQRP